MHMIFVSLQIFRHQMKKSYLQKGQKSMEEEGQKMIQHRQLLWKEVAASFKPGLAAVCGRARVTDLIFLFFK